MMLVASFLQPTYRQGYARSPGESAHPQLWRGLVGAWVPALGPTGLTLRDISQFRNHGTLTNMAPATDWVIGGNARVPGYALDFDGSNDNVNLGKTIYGSGIITVIVGLNQRTQADDTFLFHEDASGAGLRFHTRGYTLNDFVLFANFNGATNGFWSTPKDSATLGVWLQAAFTYDSSSSANVPTFYLDGKEVSRTNIINPAGSFDPGTINTTIGRSSSSFDGLILYLYVFKRILSAVEMRHFYFDPLAPFRLRRRAIGVAPAAPGGRTTRNTRSFPLGTRQGMGMRVPF